MAGARPPSSRKASHTPPLVNGYDAGMRAPTSRSTSASVDDTIKSEARDHADGATPGVKLEGDPSVKADIDDLYNFDMDSASTSRSPSSELKTETAALKLEDDRPSATPPVSSRGKPKTEPQLIGHLPRAEDAAMRNFVQLEQNHYQYGTLGRSREALESMTCECQYEHGVDDPDDACGSDCINRLTQVECMPDDCRCRAYCQNQRFQRRDYAPIEIVQTEMKGFGLRAAADLPKDTFIYEYLGDVVSQPTFLKRMRQYGEEGIRHFYFMMLQKDEFIDATKRGGIGRFANHSCNPNCYVAKWTVGHHVRMGIFANRYIKKNEELTFNYNVDRYGHEAQPCYCGEPNCVGFIGGKTQTDIAAMDDLYLDALGISEEVAVLGLKGSKKRKSKKLDEDFIPTLKPLIETDIPKVVQALRQTQSRKVLMKLLTRIKMTEDQPALRQLMRLRGFSVMTNILEDYASDAEVSILALECMSTWPLIQRNKVEDSKVNVPVEECTSSENETLAELAKKLLAQWDTLEYAYRIPKRLKGECDDDDAAAPSSTPAYQSVDPRPQKRARPESLFVYEYEATKDDFKLRNPAPAPTPKEAPKEVEPPKPVSRPNPHLIAQQRERDVAAIIAKASAAAEAALAAAAVAPAPDEDKDKDEEQKRREAKEARRKKRKQLSQAEKEANKEKRLLKLVGAVVVKCMSKHRDQFDHDQFKKHAKELTHVIAEKEKKSSSYREGRLDALSEEKTLKIKKFAKEYIAKILRKLEKKRRESGSGGGNGGPAPAASTSASTPAETEASLAATVADVMDLDGPDDGDIDIDDDVDMDMDGADLQQTPEQASPLLDSETPPSDSLGTPSSAGAGAVVSDPRLRHRKEECGWDPDAEKMAGRVRPVVVSAVSVS